jgi:hypothetical protein
MPRCQFTDEELGAETREEHTIQRSLGGRVKSVEVTSSSFNERCGSELDPYLSAVYAEVMHVLGPALPLESRSGLVGFKIPGHSGNWVINERGQMLLKGVTVVARDPHTNRPLSAIGPDLDSLQPMIRQLGSPPVRQIEMLPPSAEGLFPERAVLHWRIEVAALKATLLTFDHLLKDDPARFTRSADLEPVRRFVEEIVESESDDPNTDPLADYALGVQYDPNYRILYEVLKHEAGLATWPFQHTLIVSGDLGTRVLDAVFWAFETDPHAFRLSRDWSGEGFTYVMTNGILANTGFSQAVKLARSQPLGRYNNRRCRMRVTQPLTDAEKEAAAHELAEHRNELYRRAVDYVERNCDHSVAEQLGRLARLNSLGDHRLSSAVFAHLVTLFAGKVRSSDSADRFVDLLIPTIDPAPGDALPSGSLPTDVPARGWPFWIDLYRRCLDTLRAQFGSPGHVFQQNRRLVLNQR